MVWGYFLPLACDLKQRRLWPLTLGKKDKVKRTFTWRRHAVLDDRGRKGRKDNMCPGGSLKEGTHWLPPGTVICDSVKFYYPSCSLLMSSLTCLWYGGREGVVDNKACWFMARANQGREATSPWGISIYYINCSLVEKPRTLVHSSMLWNYCLVLSGESKELHR